MLKRQHGDAANVLVDLGLDDAVILSAKAILAVKLNDLVEDKELNRARAAHALSIPQSTFRAIRNYKLQAVSLDQLMHALGVLGQHIEIVVTPSSRRTPAGISVAQRRTDRVRL